MNDTNNMSEESQNPNPKKETGKGADREKSSTRKKSTKTNAQNTGEQKKQKPGDKTSATGASGVQPDSVQDGAKAKQKKETGKDEPVSPKEGAQPEHTVTDYDNTEYEHHPDEYPFEGDQYENSNEYVKQHKTEPKPAGDKSETVDENENDDTEEDDNNESESKSETSKKKKTGNKEKKMPFLDHLEELRWTIIRSLIAVMLTSIVSYIFSKEIITFLRGLGPQDLKLIFLAPTEGFMIYIKVSLWAGLVFAFPYIAYQFWQFIVPGLYEKERKYVPHIAFFTTLCFVTGAAFASFIIIPFGLKFLLGFQTNFLEANITIGKYLGFVVTIILVFGVVFELPVLSFFLTKIGLLTPQFLQKNRRYGIVMIFIAAAVLTPPDVFTQLLLAGPLILLYEISILVSKAVLKKQSQ